MKGLKHTTFSFFVRVVLGVFLFGSLFFVGFAADLIPPQMSDITIENVTDEGATITWKTNEESDSLVNYGLSNDYGIVRDPLPDKTEHLIELEDLESATTYHFRALSSDEFGNQRVSGDFTFTTSGVVEISELEEVIEDEDQQHLAAKALSIIDQITDPEALELIIDKVEEVAGRVVLPPTIIGAPNIDDVGEDYAVISWKTDRESTSLVSFVSEDRYDPSDEDPYIHTQGDTEEYVILHKIEIIGLDQATTYHFQVHSEDVLGLEGKSVDVTFMTTSTLPSIVDLKMTKVEETAATFSWNTTVPAAGYVEYTNMTTGEIRTEGSPELVSGHTVRLSQLIFGTQYSAVIHADNASGDRVTSDPISFVTVRDKYPPAISKVTNESTLYPSADSKIQTIVSWETDEVAYCQLFYAEGLTRGEDGDPSFPREKEPVSEHVQVVVEFRPSTVYKFWIVCDDHAGNSTKSEDFVLFTPEKEKSIIDIILENFEGTFGWVKDIGK